MTILLSGASGFVGAALLRRLQREGLGAVAFPRVFGFSHDTCFAPALVDVYTVVHLAARVQVMRDPDADPLAAFRAVNVGGTLSFARQAAAAGVKRFVFLSSVKVNGESTQIGQLFREMDLPNPQDAYGQSRYEAEVGLQQFAEETGMEVVIIRPPLVYGPGVKANFAARVLPVPVWALKATAALLGKSDAMQRLCGNLRVDISKACRLLGWVPPVSVEEGLRRAVAGRADEANI